MFRIALDTNVLAYLAGVDRSPQDGAKVDTTRDLIARLNEQATLIAPVQALGELFVVLTRKAKREAADARSAVLGWSDSFPLIGVTTALTSMTIDDSHEYHARPPRAAPMRCTAARSPPTSCAPCAATPPLPG